MASIEGNIEVGRTRINGENHLTIKEDTNGGGLLYVFEDGVAYEIKFADESDREDLEGHDPEKCLILERPRIILVQE